MYNIDEKRIYKHVFDGIPRFGSCIGYDKHGEYFAINHNVIAKLVDYVPTSTKTKEIVDKLISMSDNITEDGNPYIIYLSYKKR